MAFCRPLAEEVCGNSFPVRPSIAFFNYGLISSIRVAGKRTPTGGDARKVVGLGDERLAMRSFPDVAVPARPTVEPAAATHRARSLTEAVREASKNIERDLIAKALERTQWNRMQAAQELQINVRSLYKKMRQLGFLSPADSQDQTDDVV